MIWSVALVLRVAKVLKLFQLFFVLEPVFLVVDRVLNTLLEYALQYIR